jgi:hypothetical protein
LHFRGYIQGLDYQIYAQKCDAAGNPFGGYYLTGAGQVLAMHQG